MSYQIGPLPRLGLALVVCALGIAPAFGAAPANPTWADRAKQALTSPSDAEITAARKRVDVALARVLGHLNQLPEGGHLKLAIRLDELATTLTQPEQDIDAAQRVLAALRVKRPGELPALLSELRLAWESWSGLKAMDEPALARARQAVDRLADWDPRAPLTDAAEAEVRQAFAELAMTHRIDPELNELRQATSQPNQRVAVNAVFLQQIAAREFDAPVEVRQRKDGTTITAHGTLPVQTRLQLPDNQADATLRLLVKAQGPIALSACRKKIQVCAQSQVCLDGTQDYFLTAGGVRHEDPHLELGNRTRLTGVHADLRVGARLAERVIARAAAKRLPEADRSAARAAKPKIAERVNEECDDIAFRINGLFQALYLTPFAAEDIDPAVQFRSSSAGITWDATYARHDQLGALSPPPSSRVPPEQLSYLISIHESAINNLAEQLAGTWLDEATYWILLNEEFKLQSPEVEALPPGRLATAVHFAKDEPLAIHVDDQSIHIDLTVDQWRLSDMATGVSRAEHVSVTYRIVPGADGVRLVRTNELEADESLKEVLLKYLPGELRPRRKFQNAGVPRRLMVRELNLDDGWLVIGTGPVVDSPVAKKSREVAR